MDKVTTTICENAVNKLADANTIMCEAIEVSVRELTNNGEKTVLLNKKIDCATCSPLIQVDYNAKKECVYVTSEDEDEISLDDLTANELFEILNLFLLGNYELVNE